MGPRWDGAAVAATRVLPLWIALVGLAGAIAVLPDGPGPAWVVSGESSEPAPVDSQPALDGVDPLEPIATTPDSSTTRTTALGPVEAPVLPPGPFLPVEMVMAGSGQDDPVASCAPEATGPTVWRLPRYSGDRILWRTEFVADAMVAVYEVVDGSLVEVACTRSPAGQVAQGMWHIPAGSIILIRGLASPTWGNLSFGPI